jgi:hypothetical protein
LGGCRTLLPTQRELKPPLTLLLLRRVAVPLEAFVTMLSETSALLFVMDLLVVLMLLLHAWGAVDLLTLLLLLLRAWGAVGRLHVHTAPHGQDMLTVLLYQQGLLV